MAGAVAAPCISAARRVRWFVVLSIWAARPASEINSDPSSVTLIENSAELIFIMQIRKGLVIRPCFSDIYRNQCAYESSSRNLYLQSLISLSFSRDFAKWPYSPCLSIHLNTESDLILSESEGIQTIMGRGGSFEFWVLSYRISAFGLDIPLARC